jgi:hypothetical protein
MTVVPSGNSTVAAASTVADPRLYNLVSVRDASSTTCLAGVSNRNYTTSKSH